MQNWHLNWLFSSRYRLYVAFYCRNLWGDSYILMYTCMNKKQVKKSLFCIWKHKERFIFKGLMMLLFKKKEFIFLKIWCETMQNPCFFFFSLVLFSWKKLKPVKEVFLKPIFTHVCTNIWVPPPRIYPVSICQVEDCNGLLLVDDRDNDWSKFR